MFNVGDNAVVTHEIIRKDGKSIARVGERVKITSVYRGKKYTIVSIAPYTRSLPMIDICCDHNGPLTLCT